MEGIILSVVEALHCSGCFSACRGAHFPVCEEDYGTGLALRLDLLGCQGSCGIVPNGLTNSYSGYSGHEVSAYSIDTDLNYDKI